MKQERLQQYARLIVRKGLHVQKDQPVIIYASLYEIDVTRFCVEEAYKMGASVVEVMFKDEDIMRLKYTYESLEQLAQVDIWKIEGKRALLEKGACVLHLISEVPGIMKDVDAHKISTASLAMANASKDLQEYTMLNKTQWCIAAVPNTRWAQQVFPTLQTEKALESLWEHILACARVYDEKDAQEEWLHLNTQLKTRERVLNAYQFHKIHFSNGKGTDLEVELVKDHIWCGGSEKTLHGIEFQPNIPTEEIFTMPKCTGVNGIVHATRPLLYQGVLIRDFWLQFQDGKVIKFDAKEGKEALETLLHYYKGSSYLGEVALVPNSSPISISNLLFYNTLFDENASCHLALGDAYPTNIKNGSNMSQEERKQAGVNSSLIHVDFMFGSEDMKVVGKCLDGKEVIIFNQGEFVIL